MKSKIMKWYERHERAIHAVLDITCDAIPGAGVVKGALEIIHKVDLDGEDVHNQEKIKDIESMLEMLKVQLDHVIIKVENMQSFHLANSLEKKKNVIKNNNRIYKTLNPLIPEVGNIIITSLTGQKNYRRIKDISKTSLCGGKYILEEHIATGGQGSVYRGINTYIDREVAIKLLPKEFSSNTHGIDILKEDYKRLVDKLTHPHIVQYRNVDYTPELNQWFITLDYIKGKTLRRLIYEKGKKSFDSKEISLYLSPIAEALKYAHTQGIVHCDIKPENILVDENSTSFLTDFGLSQEVQSMISVPTIDNGENNIQGTLPYMSPEQYKGWGARKQTDIWSFGVILYEMLTGRHPFNAKSFKHYKEIICNESPEPIPNQELWNIISPFFTKEYQHRNVNIIEALEAIHNYSSKNAKELIILEEEKTKEVESKKVPSKKTNDDEENLLKQARQGSSKQRLSLANYYEQINELEKAFKWYKKASVNGNQKAMAKVGEYYRYGRGTKRNIDQAISTYEKLVELGHKLSMLTLVEIYATGKENERNLELASYWYKQAIRNTKNKDILTQAQKYFEQYLKEYVDEEQFNKEVNTEEEILKRKINTGGDRALKDLGDYYTREGEHRKAHTIYERISFEAYPQIAFKIAENYFSGKYTKTDIDKAYEIYRKGVERKMLKAYVPLIRVYIAKGKATNYDNALNIYYEFMNLANENQQKEVTDIYNRSLKPYEKSKKKKAVKETKTIEEDKISSNKVETKVVKNKKPQSSSIPCNKTIEELKKIYENEPEVLKKDELVRLGDFYLDTNKDYKKAYDIFSKLPVKKNLQQLLAIADYYSSGWWNRDFRISRAIYERAVQEKITSCYMPLINMCLYEIGGATDMYKALDLYYELKMIGNNKEKKEAREIYTEKLSKIENKEFRKAIKKFKKGDIGDIKKIEEFYSKYSTFSITVMPEITISLGEYYTNELKQPLNAKKIYEKAIKKQVKLAYAPLMEMYIHGNGVDKNLDKALEIYRELEKIGLTGSAKELYRTHLRKYEKEQIQKKQEGSKVESKKRYLMKSVLLLALFLGILAYNSKEKIESFSLAYYSEQELKNNQVSKRKLEASIYRAFMNASDYATQKNTSYVCDQLEKEIENLGAQKYLYRYIMAPYIEYKEKISYSAFSNRVFMKEYAIYESKLEKIDIKHKSLLLSLPYFHAIENYWGENYKNETNEVVKNFYLDTIYEYSKTIAREDHVGIKAMLLNSLGRLSNQLLIGQQSSAVIHYREKIIKNYMEEFERIYKTLSNHEKKLELIELGVWFKKEIPEKYK